MKNVILSAAILTATLSPIHNANAMLRSLVRLGSLGKTNLSSLRPFANLSSLSCLGLSSLHAPQSSIFKSNLESKSFDTKSAPSQSLLSSHKVNTTGSKSSFATNTNTSNPDDFTKLLPNVSFLNKRAASMAKCYTSNISLYRAMGVPSSTIALFFQQLKSEKNPPYSPEGLKGSVYRDIVLSYKTNVAILTTMHFLSVLRLLVKTTKRGGLHQFPMKFKMTSDDLCKGIINQLLTYISFTLSSADELKFRAQKLKELKPYLEFHFHFDAKAKPQDLETLIRTIFSSEEIDKVTMHYSDVLIGYVLADLQPKES